jgi:hypothetical protein
MIKVLFVIFYEAINYLACIKKQFELYGIEVDTYPLLRYAYDSNDKISNYKEHMNAYIKKSDPQIILWWFLDVPGDVFEFIKASNSNRYFVIYNSDDPFNLNKTIFDVCRNFDLILTPSESSIVKYRHFSCNNTTDKKILYCPFGTDPEMCTPISREMITTAYQEEYTKYECDISIYSHNFFINKELYPKQWVYSMDFLTRVRDWAVSNNKIFRIYGSHIIKEYFPDNYYGDVPYHEVNLIYNFSRINISLHGNCYGLALNQYDLSIMASGGLLFTDNLSGAENVFTPDRVVVFSKEGYVNQISTILDNYEANPMYYDRIKANARIFALNYTWSFMVENIIKEYGTKHFDGPFYSKLYGYELSEESLLQYWIIYGMRNKECCWKFVVPDGFNHEEYLLKWPLKPATPERAYLHWHDGERDPIYFKTKKSNSFDPSTFGITLDQYCSTLVALGKIRTSENKREPLLELQALVNQSPGIAINDILDTYVENL